MSKKTIIIESLLGGFLAGGILVAFAQESVAFLPVWAKILIHSILIAVMVFELLFPFLNKEEERYIKNRNQIKKSITASTLTSLLCSAAVLFLFYDSEGLSIWFKTIIFAFLIGSYICQLLNMYANVGIEYLTIADSLLKKDDNFNAK